MRIVVVGGSGLIGDKVMTALDEAGHKAVAASPAFAVEYKGWTRPWRAPRWSSTCLTLRRGVTRRS
jgi:aspartate-semialdehyde dehydrogenase